jgi:hypothetical protein
MHPAEAVGGRKSGRETVVGPFVEINSCQECATCYTTKRQKANEKRESAVAAKQQAVKKAAG